MEHRQYYINRNGKQEGPFNLETIQGFGLNRNTLIWYEGLEKWTTVGALEEFQDLLKAIPPPLEAPVPPPLPPFKKKGFSRKQWMIAAGVFLIMLIGVYAYAYQQEQAEREEMERILQEQQAQILEHERMEAERKALEERQRQEALAKKRKQQLEALQTELNHSLTSLRLANEELEEVKRFRLLRSRSQREAEVAAQVELIRYWEMEVQRLEREMEKYR